MARNLLTIKAIEAAKKPKLRDGDGLWLHTGRTGSRHWVFIWIRNQRRREMGLGPYGTGTGQVSLTAARAKAEEIRGILGRGGDPFVEMEERKNQVKPLTFGQVADEYIDTMKVKWRGAKTLAAWERLANTYAKSIRRIPVAEIDTDAVVRILRPLWQEKQETATKVRERVKIILDHAAARGLRSKDNPAIWVGHLDQILPKHDPDDKEHHPALPYADVPKMMAGLRAVDSVAARCLEFCILNANRPGETRGATWDEFDLVAAVWTIPAARMKEKRQHRIPLSPAALAILKKMETLRLGKYVFPGARDKRPLSDMTLTKVLRKLVGSDYTVHGTARSSFRDWVSEETHHQSEIAEAALSHAVGDAVERAYKRGDVLKKRRALMEDWANFCSSTTKS